MNLARQLWRALLPHRVPIKPGDRFRPVNRAGDPFSNYEVTVTRVSDDGQWIEYQFKYGYRSSLRRDRFASLYEAAP